MSKVDENDSHDDLGTCMVYTIQIKTINLAKNIKTIKKNNNKHIASHLGDYIV